MYLKMILLLGMLFLHIIDDYYLQGILASMKQKLWWENNAPDSLYKHDYIMALCEHTFSWTFMIMLIPTIYIYFHQYNGIYGIYIFLFIFNCIIHGIVDDYKANKRKINLIQDQLIHISQIIITWFIFISINYN